jgi:hypothetical protein
MTHFTYLDLINLTIIIYKGLIGGILKKFAQNNFMTYNLRVLK